MSKELKQELAPFLKKYAKGFLVDGGNAYNLSDNYYRNDATNVQDITLQLIGEYDDECLHDEFYYIYRVHKQGEPTNVYIRLDGYYSEIGARFTSWCFTKPTEKTIIVYEKE